MHRDQYSVPDLRHFRRPKDQFKNAKEDGSEDFDDFTSESNNSASAEKNNVDYDR